MHKKGFVYDPNNFRGISLINTVCKIFTKYILVTRLDKWTEKFNVIHESQAGFRRNYSTIDNIFTLHALVQKYLNKKRGRFYTLFIDFRKAFDSMKHDKLWDALERKGTGGNFLNVWKSLYGKLKSCVKIDDNLLTTFFDCSIGTRQGWVGSPKIFTLFINDLKTYLETKLNRGIFVTTEIPDLLGLIFADDVSCFADTVVGLQRVLNELEIFCNSVSVNGKTSIFFPCNIGVRQGENLSPLLFSIFLNDLEDFLCENGNLTGVSCASNDVNDVMFMYLKVFVLLYADDTVIIAESAEDLQKSLTAYALYCETWKLLVNGSKTKIVIFSRGRLQNFNFVLNDESIEIVKEFKYLGILFSRSGSFSAAKKHIAAQATRAMFCLLRKARSLCYQ